jgi:hypothetical protein
MSIKDSVALLPDCITSDLVDATAEPTVRQLPAMNMNRLGFVLALIVAMPNLVGCAGSRDSADEQFQRQVKRARGDAPRPVHGLGDLLGTVWRDGLAGNELVLYGAASGSLTPVLASVPNKGRPIYSLL